MTFINVIVSTCFYLYNLFIYLCVFIIFDNELLQFFSPILSHWGG